MKIIHRVSTCLGTALACLALAGGQVAQAQIVEKPIAPIATGSGLVAGKVLPSGVQAWLGVPFAKPPVQELRWQPPQPMSWQGTWNADRKGPECIQVLRPHNINHYFGEEPTSENCLYLNIWAPAKAKAGARLPVIVFIYGGGNTIGSSGMAVYGGENVAKSGKALFVNLNYRVGILGFMAHPELTQEQGGHSGNYAYLDQNAALRWIHDNIAKFGGDPDKVLVSGQSAGAMSVTSQLFSPLAKGLFRAALMSSGCGWDAGSAISAPLPLLADAEQTGLDIQQRLGAANLDAMRQVPADRILALQAEAQVGNNTPGVRVGGVVDGYFTTGQRLDVLKAHQFNDVPIIASFNREDLDAGNPLVRARSVAEFRYIVEQMYGADSEEFMKLYPVKSVAEIRTIGLGAAREMGLEARARSCGRLMSEYNKSPAYLDMFALPPSFAPGVKIADTDTATAGAYHTADIPFWFGTLDAFNMFRTTRAWNDWDRTLSAQMMDSLVAFAATGSPNTDKIHWPAWSSTDEQKLVFADKVEALKLATQRMDWIAAHPARPVALPPAPVRPRD
jgi:para-nitrobenzyl esterase